MTSEKRRRIDNGKNPNELRKNNVKLTFGRSNNGLTNSNGKTTSDDWRSNNT
ncbi:hypothetical protein HC928_11025 [bacterium]|nr:hypothetical protein [bacterium]